MITVSIMGFGRVGGALAAALPRDKYAVVSIVCRGRETSRPLPDGATLLTEQEIDRIDSDILFITTRDPEIAGACRSLAAGLRARPIVLHTSGSYSSTILSQLTTIGYETGSLHPLVSISDPELGPERFRGAFFCVEGTPVAAEAARNVALDLRGKPFAVDTAFKTLYHAAAVTACGHMVALFDAAVEMMTKCGLSPEDSKAVLLPLVASTVRNLETQDTAAALTGTFARADADTFTRHLATLNSNASEELLEIYLLLGERSLQLAAKQGVSAERVDSLRTKVLIAKSKLKW